MEKDTIKLYIEKIEKTIEENKSNKQYTSKNLYTEKEVDSFILNTLKSIID